jgi:hypothetical protein
MDFLGDGNLLKLMFYGIKSEDTQELRVIRIDFASLLHKTDKEPKH